MKYEISVENLATQYIRIKAEITANSNITELTFPAWRPGRYEIADFVKNTKNITFHDEHGQSLPFSKIEKNKWSVETNTTSTINVTYNFHAAELNAGSTFVDHTQLYVNPVNCLIYDESLQNEACELSLDIDPSWKVACAMQKEGEVFVAADYHELVDSPLIASASLQHDFYVVNNIKFHIWFQGECKPDWNKIKDDFSRFTQKQLEHFKAFPTNEYHFMFQIAPYQLYHGVEHMNSTVIALGPSFEIMEDLYTEFLGVSSHELYHAWNIKSIRPQEMMPYDYSQENYSKLGFVCEGVTTYLGDQFLLKSGVFDLKQYLIELQKNVQRHFDNFGRFSLSVADSSFDTWVDGYVQGAPNRKTSIYVEGSLIALMCDVRIMNATNNAGSINDVMRNLYEKFALKNIGYTEADYKNELELVAGVSFDDIFENFVYGTTDYQSDLTETLTQLGIELLSVPAKSIMHSKLGIKNLNVKGKSVVKKIYPDCPLDTAGIMLEDKIIAVNGIVVGEFFEKWLTYFKNDDLTLTIERSNQLLELKTRITEKNYFMTYNLKQVESRSTEQTETYNFWIK